MEHLGIYGIELSHITGHFLAFGHIARAGDWRTADIAKAGDRVVGTREMGRLIREKLKSL